FAHYPVGLAQRTPWSSRQHDLPCRRHRRPALYIRAIGSSADRPPSTGTVTPVTWEDSSEASHTATSAMSSGVARRPCGTDAVIASRTSGRFAVHARNAGDSTVPGAMAF